MPFSFARPTLQQVPGHVGGAVRVWNLFKSLNTEAIAEEADRPFHLALIGTDDQTALVASRLALESPTPRDLGPSGPADVRPYVGIYPAAEAAPLGSLRLDADALTADESRLAGALAQLVLDHPDRRLALARHVPAFRPAVAARLIAEMSKENARIALLSALPGVIPLTGFLLPATALGDMILLTKNQALLLLQIAAAYGQTMDLRRGRVSCCRSSAVRSAGARPPEN